MNQILVLVIIRKGFTQLLRDPKAGRMVSDVAVQDSSAVMGDYEEAIQSAEGDCWNSEEIHRSDSFAVIVNEGCQRLTGSGFFGAFCTQRDTVRSERSNPSFSSSP